MLDYWVRLYRLYNCEVEQVQALGEALLDFESEADLERWLEQVNG